MIGFGGGNDFHISEDSDKINYSQSFFGRKKDHISYTYKLPDGVEENSEAALRYLAGACFFQVDEMELYIVNNL